MGWGRGAVKGITAAFERATESVVCAIASVLASRVVCCGGRSNGWWIYWAPIIILCEGNGWLAEFWRFRVCLRSNLLRRGRDKGSCVLQVIEFPLSNLLPDDVDIKREVKLLHDFDGEAWKQRDDDGAEKNSPEDQTSVDLCTTLVELCAGGKGSIYSGPEPYHESADNDDQEHDPVPSERIEEDVEVGGENSYSGDEYAHPFEISDIQSITRGEISRRKDEIDHEECDSGLINTVQHIHPIYY